MFRNKCHIVTVTLNCHGNDGNYSSQTVATQELRYRRCKPHWQNLRSANLLYASIQENTSSNFKNENLKGINDITFAPKLSNIKCFHELQYMYVQRICVHSQLSIVHVLLMSSPIIGLVIKPKILCKTWQLMTDYTFSFGFSVMRFFHLHTYLYFLNYLVTIKCKYLVHVCKRMSKC